jgi:two-component system, OmpR family, phosphate regulon sensor histidine kinase PhoR
MGNVGQTTAGRRVGNPDGNRLLRSFLDISLGLTQDLDIERVLAVIVERSIELTGARYGAAVTLTPEGSMENFLHRGLTPEQVASLPHLPRGKGLLGLVLERGAPVRTADIGSHPAAVGFPDRHVAMAAFLGVPMKHHDKLVGALYLTKPPGPSPFSSEDEELVTAMAAMAAVGIENARLFAVARDRAERVSLLGALASQVRLSLDVRDVLATTVEVLGRAAEVERCFIRLLATGEAGPLGPIEHEWHAPETSSLKDDPARQYPVSSMAAITRTTQWSDDVGSDGRLLDPALPGDPGDLLQRDTKAVLSTPLQWGRELLGVVTFHSRRPRKWSDADVELIEAASREVAAALHNARLYDEAVQSADRLRELDKMRSEFVSAVSHELRSPMTVVAGIADILEKRYDDLPLESRIELIETLGREARRLTRLVSDVLDLESTNRSAEGLRIESIDLAELARESAADGGLAHRTRLIAEAGNAIVSVDRDRIKQVILNLLSNAAKFSGEGAPITLSVLPQKHFVQVTVSDQGPGIAEAEQHLLFQRFSRLAHTSAGHPGSGLGLYLCKAMVERHGGRIWVDSVAGAGATFGFTIPR